MQFIKTNDKQMIKELKALNYKLIHIENNNMHVFLNDPPYDNKFSDNRKINFTNNLNF